jgi:release factor glutamine methyltransferase
VTVRPAEVLRRATRYLDRHGVESPGPTAEVLLMHVLETDRASLYTRERGLDAREARMFGRAICQRCTGVPVQHLTGRQGFRRIVVEVRPGVFVPRPETELLVEHAMSALGDATGPVIVDAGTGTGAIALSIKDEYPEAAVFATDLSPEAVELARANADRLGLEVSVFEGDLLSALPEDLRGRVDLVVSNPPYLPEAELDGLPPEVRADPPLALVGDLGPYRRLATDAPRWLREGGVLAVEIDARRGDDVVRVLGATFADVRVEPDLAGRDRVVVARAT